VEINGLANNPSTFAIEHRDVLSPSLFHQPISNLTIWHTLQSMSRWGGELPGWSATVFSALRAGGVRAPKLTRLRLRLCPTHSEIDHLAHFAKYDLVGRANSPAGQPHFSSAVRAGGFRASKLTRPSPSSFLQHIPRLTIGHTLQSMTLWGRRTHRLVSQRSGAPAVSWLTGSACRCSLC
jgi:hypothetical protein